MPISPPDAYQGARSEQWEWRRTRKGISGSRVSATTAYVFKHGNPHQSVRLTNTRKPSIRYCYCRRRKRLGLKRPGLPPRLQNTHSNGAWCSDFGTCWATNSGVLPSILTETPGRLTGGRTPRVWPDGASIGSFNGGGIKQHPVTVDGEDNIWVANFGPLELTSDFTGRLTKLWGVNAPPAHNVGDPITANGLHRANGR